MSNPAPAGTSPSAGRRGGMERIDRFDGLVQEGRRGREEREAGGAEGPG